MTTTPIEQLYSTAAANLTQKTSEQQSTGQSLFGDIFMSVIENVKQTDAEKTEAEYLLATGQLDNPSVLTIASTKNEIAVELLVQLRNKALDAYSEITRISL